IGGAFEPAIETVRPAVIRTAKHAGRTLGLGHDGRGMMAAHVEEGAEHSVLATDYHHGLAAREFAREIVARLTNLVDSPRVLPSAGEDAAALQRQHSRVGVPERGNGGGGVERDSR